MPSKLIQLKTKQKTRLPIANRVEKGKRPGFRMTRRDLKIIQAINKYRVLSTPQIEALFFRTEHGQSHQSKSSRCRHRLKLLFHHGYLNRYEQPSRLSEGRKPIVYSLDRQGISLLISKDGQSQAQIDSKPSNSRVGWQFLDHLLATNDFRIAIELATKESDISLHRWFDEKYLKSQIMKDMLNNRNKASDLDGISVIPDGYFQLMDKEFRYHHFLEIDRATETIESSNPARKTIGNKIIGYLTYYNSGILKSHLGAKSMRVLIVTTSQTRLSNMKSTAEKLGGRRMFWFTTFDQLTLSTIYDDPIWSVAGYNGTYKLFNTHILLESQENMNLPRVLERLDTSLRKSCYPCNIGF